MKFTTPLYILTTITGLLINQTTLADDSSKTARFYEKKDLPEFSRKIIVSDINSNKDSHESFSINRDALFHDDSDEFSDVEANTINTSNNKQFLSEDITSYPVKVDAIDNKDNAKYLNMVTNGAKVKVTKTQ